jgi:hypothetical protein
VADMDHERAAADRGALDPFRGEAQIVCHRHQRLAAVAMPSMSAGDPLAHPRTAETTKVSDYPRARSCKPVEWR